MREPCRYPPRPHRDRLCGPEARADIFLGHGDGETAAVGHRAVKILRELACIDAVEPIFIVERRADGANALAKRVEILFGRKWAGGGHNLSPWSGAGKRAARGLQMGNIDRKSVV